jgi:hypothetical protein
MIDLYGKSHCFVQFGQAPGPFQTSRAAIKTQPRGDGSIWRVNVPGYGWRTLRYPTLTERRAGNRSPYVILTGAERATISAED